MIKRIAVVEWSHGDGIAKAISDELIALGIEPVLFPYNGTIPNNVDMVLTFAPYNKFLPIASQMEHMDSRKRPIFVHWNTENPPDPQLPWFITKNVAGFRSWIERWCDTPRPMCQRFARLKPVQWLNRRMYRYRMLGDYEFAIEHGWLDLLVETSSVFAQQDIEHGLPAVFVPWGTSHDWYADLHLKRDIDVLWFGKRRTKRRSNLIDSIRHELQAQGVNMMVIDNVERPFIFGDERTQILNRTKIVISLLTQPYEYVCPFRFHMVAGNRCMVISEPELCHHPDCIPGKHLINAKANEMVEKILYYLNRENERNQIVENAYQLVTQQLTLGKSVKAILNIVENRINSEGPMKMISNDQVLTELAL
jgi:hypothetical protein